MHVKALKIQDAKYCENMYNMEENLDAAKVISGRMDIAHARPLARRHSLLNSNWKIRDTIPIICAMNVNIWH